MVTATRVQCLAKRIMLRIIGGEQRGRKIEVPGGNAVRPPTDRVREAIFNLLRRLVAGRPAFDLFAGSGALGLESLSRGASHATFVESDNRVAAALRRNIRHLNYDDRATVLVADVLAWAQRLARWPSEPATVLIAPPYAYFDSRLADLQTLWATLVAEMPPDTAIVMQAPRSFARESLPPVQDWELRRYGDTQVVICQTEKQAVVGDQAEIGDP
jgi:16S rRNA (guanine966-N2)-methyltransferase